MPIYEYRCNQCGKAFEELVFADTRVACPACQATQVTKQWSVPAPPQGARSAAVPSAACDAGFPQSGCCGGGGCHQH